MNAPYPDCQQDLNLSTAEVVAKLKGPYEGNGAIVGQVVEKENQRGIPGTSVFVVDENSTIEKSFKGAESAENGYYFIGELLPGQYNLTSRFIGFDEVQLESIEIEANTMYVIDIALGECLLHLIEPY